MHLFSFFWLFFASFSCYSAVLPNLPDLDTIADKQARIVAAPDPVFIEHVSDGHIPTIHIPDLTITPPPAADHSYFNTSDMKVVYYYIEKAIGYARSPAIPVHTTLVKKAPHVITINCNLGNSGDITAASSPYFHSIGGFAFNAVPDAAHPHGGFTNQIQIVVRRENGAWRFKTAHPVGYI